MKKSRCLFLTWSLLLCYYPKLVVAQNKLDDSLKTVLQQQNLPDSTRFSIYMQLGSDYQYSGSDQAKAYFQNAYNLAHRKNDKFQMEKSLSGIGDVCYSNAQYDSAQAYFLKAISLFKTDTSLQAKASVATSKANLANIELVRNNYAAAIQQYLEAIEMIEQSNVTEKYKTLGNLNAAVATVYHDLRQFDMSLLYDLRGLAAHRQAKNNQLLTAYLELYVSEDLLTLNRFSEARQQLSRAATLIKEVNTSDLYQRYYQTWGQLYQKSSAPDSAAWYYQKALRYAEETKNRFKLMDNLRMLAYAYRDEKNYVLSEKYMRPALQEARSLKNQRLECELLNNMGLVTAAQNKSKQAVSYYQQYIHLSDSLKEGEVKQRVNEIAIKYQATEIKDSLSLLQKGLLLQQAELRKKNAQNTGLIGGCTMLILLSGAIYKNFRNKNQLLKQNEELHSRRITVLEKERKLIVMQSILKGQEEERSRLARDLHDGVGGMLSGVKFSLATMKGDVFISQKNAETFNQALMQLDQSIAELRQVSHNMMPESLLKYGLAETLENYCSRLNRSGKLQVELQTYGMEPRLEQSTEIIIYRIVQELLHNILRHANATNALVQLVREGNRFSCTVEDDGKGFDVREAEEKSGAGLTNIRTRVAYLNGTLDIRSTPGEGTSVYIEGNCS